MGAVLLLGVLTLGGCAATRPQPPRPAPATLPSVAALDGALAGRRAALHGLRGLARLHYRDGDEVSASRQAVVVARPDRVRVEVLSLLGTVFLFVTEDGQLTAYVRDQHTVYRGAASPQNLARYARIGLPIETLVDLLLATPMAGPDGVPAEVSFDADRGAVRLRRVDDGTTYLVWFSEQMLPVAAAVREGGGAAVWEARFEQYEGVGGVAVATHIVVDLPRAGQTMDVELQDVDVNPVVDPTLFALQVPPGSRLVELPAVTD